MGVPVVPVDDDEADVDDDADAEDDAPDDFDDEEPPHALMNAAVNNRQAAMAASLLQRMASLILGSPRFAASPGAAVGPESGRRPGQRGADVNTIVNDLVGGICTVQSQSICAALAVNRRPSATDFHLLRGVIRTG
ncbi:MAG: hypothetical protein JO304_10975 [Solirubrobacterales bacterium]|nr:hypothetical protein [Solirubrobacterales bacterium]